MYVLSVSLQFDALEMMKQFYSSETLESIPQGRGRTSTCTSRTAMSARAPSIQVTDIFEDSCILHPAELSARRCSVVVYLTYVFWPRTRGQVTQVTQGQVTQGVGD